VEIFDEGHITNIAVHPEYRQNGIGSRLVEKLVDIAKERGIVKMTLEVRKAIWRPRHCIVNMALRKWA